jgi:hypothetical protein
MSTNRKTDPSPPHDPTIADVMDVLGGLASQVRDLTDQVLMLREELRQERDSGVRHCEVGMAMAAYRREHRGNGRLPETR